MVKATKQPRCGSPVAGAVCCPSCPHQDGGGIPSPPSPRAGARTLSLAPAATHSQQESGSSPTLCLRGGGALCPGRVQPGYSSWEETAPPPQSCSPTPPTPRQLTSVYHMIPCNNCVDCRLDIVTVNIYCLY